MFKSLYEAIRGDAEPKQITLNGRCYTTAEAYPVETPLPTALTVTTLTAIADYLKSNVDGLKMNEILCHVESPSCVSLTSNLTGDFSDRAYFMCAKLEQLQLRLNTFHDGETFNILLQSCFMEPEDVAKATDRGLVLAYAANVTESVEGNTLDDGVTQAVTVRKGISSKSTDVLPNPVTLRPWRTFPEVEQPASKFVFRAKEGPTFALIEADGGAWKGEAMRNIKSWLEVKVPGLNIIA